MSRLSLQDHLVGQLEFANLAPRDLAIARAIVDAINDDGYLTESLDDIAATLQPEVDRRRRPKSSACSSSCRRSIRPASARAPSASASSCSCGSCDPDTPGLRARAADRRQHLDLRRRARADAAAARAARHRRRARARRSRWCARCHPRPGRHRQRARRPSTWCPDVFVRRTDRGWTVEINAATLPRVRLNQSYAEPASAATRATPSMRAQLQEARWLLKSLEIRNETLMKVARSHRRAADRLPRAGRGAHAADDPQGHRRGHRHARVHDLARHLRQIHAHAARRVRAALFLLEPGGGRRRLAAPPPPRSAPRSASSSRKRTPERRCPTAASPRCSRAKASPSRAAPSRNIARRMGIAPSNERRRRPRSQCIRYGQPKKETTMQLSRSPVIMSKSPRRCAATSRRNWNASRGISTTSSTCTVS